MGIGEKITEVVKFIAFTTYVIYLCIFNSPLSGYVLSEKDGFGFKNHLMKNKCLLLLGGSNVTHGLSADLLSNEFCDASNMGLNMEFGGFYRYARWLGDDLESKYIIYSSVVFHGINPGKKESLDFEIPKSPLFVTFKNIFTNPNARYSKHGDLIEYKCNRSLKSFEFDRDEFKNSSYNSAEEISKRILYFKNLTKSDDIFFRIPPVYIEDRRNSELYMSLVKKRIELLKNFDVKIVGNTIVSSDKSLFCDAIHPNARGREKFSKEVLSP